MLTSSMHSLEENNELKSFDGGSKGGDKHSEEILLTEGPPEEG